MGPLERSWGPLRTFQAPPPSAMQLPNALDAYLVQLAANGRSPHTLDQRTRHLLPFLAWLKDRGHDGAVDGLGHELVAGFLASDTARLRADGLPRKATTANALRSSLRCFLGFAHDAGYAGTNAGRLIRRARCSPPPPRGLSDDERRRLLTALDAPSTPEEVRDRALFRLLLEAGLRVGTAVALDVEDLDLDGGELRLRCMKGDREDTAVIPSRLAGVLAEIVGERTSGPVFLAQHGGRITTRSVRRRLLLWISRAGITPASARTRCSTILHSGSSTVPAR